MEHACAKIAADSLRLKRHYHVLLGVSPGYGVDQQMTRAMDALGQLIKELEDDVVVLQIKLDELNVSSSTYSKRD